MWYKPDYFLNKKQCFNVNTNVKSTKYELCHNRAALQNSVHELVSFNQELIRQGTGNMQPPITLYILVSE